MSYTRIQARVNDQTIQLINVPLLASGGRNEVIVDFTFCQKWDEAGKTAVFYRNPEEAYHVLLVDNSAVIPAEVMAKEGRIFFGVFGTSADQIRTTEVVALSIVAGAITIQGIEPGAPTPDIYQQISSAYGLLASRVDELVAMRSTTVTTRHNLTAEYISGSISSNGYHAAITLMIAGLSIAANSWVYTDYCIPPQLLPFVDVDLKCSTDDAAVVISPRDTEDGWGRIQIYNATNSLMEIPADLGLWCSGDYALASPVNAEVADLRIGPDGTTYPTAGEAVREQTNNAVSYMAQTPTEEQKTQARKNIGAAEQTAFGIVIKGQNESVIEVEAVDQNDQAGNTYSRLRLLGYHDGAVEVNGVADGIYDDDAATVGQLKSVDITTPKSFTEEQKAQARKNIGVGEAQAVTDEKYFLIDDDGVLSLKPEYRGLGGSGYDYSKSNNGFGVEGSLIAELPENIVIPEVVNEIAVNALAPAMFYQNNRVKRLTIPSFITEIPERFCDRAKSLEQIDGTENVEIIGKAAFQQTKLKKVVFPKLKAALETATFGACYYLVSADIGNDITELPKNCFRYCERLSSIRGGANVSKLGQGTLEFTLRLKNIPFADKLTEIGKEGVYLSRVNYDWSQHSATYGENATYAHYKSPYTQVNFWTGYWDTHTVTPCEIPLRTMFNQLNPQWLVDAEQAGFTGLAKTDWPQNCALMVYAAMYSYYEQKDLTSPVEYMLAVQKADPNALNVHPGNVDGPKDWLVPLGYTWEKVDTPTSADGWVSAVEKVYQALNEGKLVYAKVVSATDPGAGNHAVLLYGINSSGEVLVFNPGNYSSTVGDYTPFTYAMPIQNLTAKGSLFHIVTKEA